MEDAPLADENDDSYSAAFGRKHEWYHSSLDSGFYMKGIVVYRQRAADGGVYKLRGRTLTLHVGGERVQPVEVATASSLREWCVLIEETFGMTIRATFTPSELALLWSRTAVIKPDIHRLRVYWQRSALMTT
jgi:hypothetical protein